MDSLFCLLVIKQKSLLSPQSINHLMRLVLLGLDDFEETTQEKLVDNYIKQKEQRIKL